MFLAMKYLFVQSCAWKVDARFVEFIEKASYRNAHERMISSIPVFLVIFPVHSELSKGLSIVWYNMAYLRSQRASIGPPSAHVYICLSRKVLFSSKELVSRTTSRY